MGAHQGAIKWRRLEPYGMVAAWDRGKLRIQWAGQKGSSTVNEEALGGFAPKGAALRGNAEERLTPSRIGGFLCAVFFILGVAFGPGKDVFSSGCYGPPAIDGPFSEPPGTEWEALAAC